MKSFCVFLLRVFFKLFYRVRIVGESNIPSQGPVLICAAHHSFMDMLFLGYKTKRWINWMAKEELFRNPLISMFLKSLGAFPVKRGKVDISSIKMSYKLLERGEMLGIFPQGTRVKSSNITTAKIKSGAALIAAHSGASIVPAIVTGTSRIFGRKDVIFGEPFKIQKEGGEKLSGEELSDASSQIMDKIYALQEKK